MPAASHIHMYLFFEESQSLMTSASCILINPISRRARVDFASHYLVIVPAPFPAKHQQLVIY
jgi:hypothetical protein